MDRRFILGLLPLFILIPYYGGLGFNNLIIFCGFIFFIFLTFVGRTTINNYYISTFVNVYFIQIFFIAFSIFLSLVFLSINFTLNDVSEIIRPLINLFIILPIYFYYKRSGFVKSMKYLKKWLIVFTLFNFFLSLVSKFDLIIFSNLIESYSEGSIYSYGYSKFRAFGIIGQPGKNAIFCNLLVLGLVYINKVNKSKIILSLIIINGLSIILTLSRVGLLIYLLIIIINFVNFNLIKKYLFSYLIIIFSLSYLLYYLSLEFFDFNLLLRGLDDGSSKFGTLDKRIYLKLWSFNTISENVTSFFFGMGPCKEYLSTLSTDFADDLTLRHPDSSFTLWMLRYGFFGLVLFYLPHLILLFSKRKFLIQVVSIIIVISNLDPPYNEPKTQVLYWMIILFLLLFEPRKSSQNSKIQVTNDSK